MSLLSYLRVPISWTEVAKRTASQVIKDNVLGVGGRACVFLLSGARPGSAVPRRARELLSDPAADRSNRWRLVTICPSGCRGGHSRPAPADQQQQQRRSVDPGPYWHHLERLVRHVIDPEHAESGVPRHRAPVMVARSRDLDSADRGAGGVRPDLLCARPRRADGSGKDCEYGGLRFGLHTATPIPSLMPLAQGLNETTHM